MTQHYHRRFKLMHVSDAPVSPKSFFLIFLIMLKRAYRYPVSLGRGGTVTMSGLTSSQYTDLDRQTHSRQVGSSTTQKDQSQLEGKGFCRGSDNNPVQSQHGPERLSLTSPSEVLS